MLLIIIMGLSGKISYINQMVVTICIIKLINKEIFQTNIIFISLFLGLWLYLENQKYGSMSYFEV